MVSSAQETTTDTRLADVKIRRLSSFCADCQGAFRRVTGLTTGLGSAVWLHVETSPIWLAHHEGKHIRNLPGTNFVTGAN
jgi:hypothetical protein